MAATKDVEAPISPVSIVPESEEIPNDTFDGKSLVIDFILAYKEDHFVSDLTTWRKVFQNNLLKAGLKMQMDTSQKNDPETTLFVKLHAPTHVLAKQADIMALKKSVKCLLNEPKKKKGRIPLFMRPNLSKDPPCLKASFREDISQVFIAEGEELEDIFTSAERSAILWEILNKTKFGDGSKEVGIKRLLSKNAYTAAYPLHDGPYLRPPQNKNSCNVCITDRQQLYQEWARPRAWYKAQPNDLIRKYFGDEIGLYFVWLGFYTKMLVPASIVGFLCFIYGVSSTGTRFNIPSQEICNTTDGEPGSFIMCPSCLDGQCPHQYLGDSCLYAELSYIFDNPATVAFAVFMSFWATMFLELWKRKQARLISEWGLTETALDMETRPEFDAHVTTIKTHPISGKEDPVLTPWNKTVRFVGAISGVLVMVGVVIIAFIGVMVYRISVAAALYATGDPFLREYSAILTASTASIINLIIIIILGVIYKNIAKWLTDMECSRTQTEYDNSLTFKIFVFEFFNCYSYLMYIAFFKGRFFTYPGDDEMWTTFFGIPGDQCDPAGCTSELFIQLVVIMVGIQIFNNFMEVVLPWFIRIYKSRSEDKERTKSKPLWEQDYELSPATDRLLFSEYLEMIMQYGFLTLFVAAFPLAPLFALLNNIVEIRVDAFNMLVQQRRPVPKRTNSIGAWLDILQTITFLAVVFNAFLIAFTTEFIPRLVYVTTRSQGRGLEGFVEFTLSVFNVSDYNAPPPTSGEQFEQCYYKGFRNSPDAEDPYSLNEDYWNVLAARLAFIVVFEHLVMGLTGMLAALIPDLPWDVKERTYEEEKLLAEKAADFREIQRTKRQKVKSS